MAPEQLTGGKMDGRVDVYATGVLLFAMLAQKLPFHESGLVDVRAVRPDVPEGIARAIRAALAEDPEERPARALDMQLAIDGALADTRRFSNAATLASWMRELFRGQVDEAEITRADAAPTRTDSSFVLLSLEEPPAQRSPSEEATRRFAVAPRETQTEDLPAVDKGSEALTARVPAEESTRSMPPPRAEMSSASMQTSSPTNLSPAGESEWGRTEADANASRRRFAGAIAGMALGSVLVAAAIWRALPTPRATGPDTPAPTSPIAPVPTPSSLVPVRPASSMSDAPPQAMQPAAVPSATSESQTQTTSTGETTSAPAPAPARPRTRTKKRTAAGEVEPEPAEAGVLVLETIPPARILVDGQRMGLTPQTVSLPAGPHDVLLEAGDRSERYPVTIVAGRRVRIFKRFD